MAKTFRVGGIHPHDHKVSAGVPITAVAPPNEVAITSAQHIGTPTTTAVNRGDKMRVGTLFDEAGGFIPANIHSSASGTITKVDQIVDASGFEKPATFVKVEDGEWEEYIDQTDALVIKTNLDAEQIIDRIAEMDIVDMGGATFSTRVKFSPPPGQSAGHVIINAVECGPYLTSDDTLVCVRTMETMVDRVTTMKAANAPHVLIGIEINKPDTTHIMYGAVGQAKGFLPEDQDIFVVPLKKHYPQGGEKQLIDTFIRKQVALDALPVPTGAIIRNTGTIFAIYETVMKHKPLVEHIIIVTGRTIMHSSNFKTRISTSMRAPIDAAGGCVEEPGKIIGGDPMMDRAFVNTTVPVARGSSGLLTPTVKRSTRPQIQDCIHCGECVSVCPMGLSPASFMCDTTFKDWETSECNYIVGCIECGSCDYTYPAGRPLLDCIYVGKRTAMGIIRVHER